MATMGDCRLGPGPMRNGQKTGNGKVVLLNLARENPDLASGKLAACYRKSTSLNIFDRYINELNEPCSIAALNYQRLMTMMFLLQMFFCFHGHDWFCATLTINMSNLLIALGAMNLPRTQWWPSSSRCGGHMELPYPVLGGLSYSMCDFYTLYLVKVEVCLAQSSHVFLGI